MADETRLICVGDAAPDITLPDQGNQPRSLAEFWRDGRVALVFLRHFG